MSDCIFCKIASGEIPSTKVFENEDVLGFRDLNPQTPVHVLVIPKKHICCAKAVNAENSALVGKCFEAIAKIAESEGLDNGFRVINNCGEDGGQSVMHLHFHLLGGVKMSEKII